MCAHARGMLQDEKCIFTAPWCPVVSNEELPPVSLMNLLTVCVPPLAATRISRMKAICIR